MRDRYLIENETGERTVSRRVALFAAKSRGERKRSIYISKKKKKNLAIEEQEDRKRGKVRELGTQN